MNQTGTLSAAGDLVVRERLVEANENVADAGYAATMKYLNEADVTFGSCEVQFTDRGYRTDSPIAYQVDPEVAHDLGRIGFDVLTVATNHTCDFGEVAFVDTLTNLRKSGITPVGGGNNLDEAMQPVITRVGDLAVGILAVSCLVPPDYSATSTRPGIAPIRIDQSIDFDPLLMIIEPGAPLSMRSSAREQDVDRLRSAIVDLRSHVDFVLVSVHFGYGRGDVLAEYQRPLAHAIVEAGADLVLGNHTHSPGPIEIHNGVPIVYSLGNHIAQQDWQGANASQQAIFSAIDEWSVVARFSLEPHHVRGIELAATYCDRSTGLPALVTAGAQAEAVFSRIERLSAPWGTKLTTFGDRATVQL
ncbi:CapA family protein [Rhodococcus sp. IEGM 1318]|uniref:CapA family protein n=1 Tax=Rhodococcus sp. IEGM 1318 TaxID=3082226 RepID=UPI0029537EFF|nr:CapA family protein [Rhodococcus sp. IEGM 1318]MDV8009499.1 CapA family protein [Rhodococcus sp. IEGM 1318]